MWSRIIFAILLIVLYKNSIHNQKNITYSKSDLPLLSACAYISTGRKPALNSKVRLTARCAQLKIDTSKDACTFMVSLRGRGQSIDRAIIHIAAFCPARNGAHCLKNLRIDSSHHDFNQLEKAGTLGKQASMQILRSRVIYALIICNMRLIANA